MGNFENDFEINVFLAAAELAVAVDADVRFQDP